MVLPRFHPCARLTVTLGGGVLVLVCTTACDKRAAPTSASAAKAEDASPPADDAPVESAVEPPAPPPVEGAVFDRGVYVQTCGEPDGCPSMLQEPAASHCTALELAGRSWRLPSKDEATRFAGLEIEQMGGYHWTNTEYAEDEAQVWIVDPARDQPTTIPRDRKPFRVRCVSERGPKPPE